MSNKTYEEEFAKEMSKAKEGKAKAAPWSSGYKKAPEILHGYDKKVKGKTAEERLDMRSGERQLPRRFSDDSRAGNVDYFVLLWSR